MGYSDNRFYVYVHRRATDDRVFYVGKGRYGRLIDKRARNPYWINVVNKHGFTAHIVMRFNHEECAFSLERALIKRYGKENLCNISDGGDGASGHTWSDESKEKLSLARKGKVLSDRHREKIAETTRRNDYRKRLSDKLMTPDVNRKLSASAKKQFLTDEDKARHSVSCGGKMVIRSDGNVYYSVSDAARKMTEQLGKKCAGQNIDRAIRNEGYTAFGYGWKFHNGD